MGLSGKGSVAGRLTSDSWVVCHGERPRLVLIPWMLGTEDSHIRGDALLLSKEEGGTTPFVFPHDDLQLNAGGSATAALFRLTRTAQVPCQYARRPRLP